MGHLAYNVPYSVVLVNSSLLTISFRPFRDVSADFDCTRISSLTSNDTRQIFIEAEHVCKKSCKEK